uniref:Protein UBASH3A-like protein n=1 Tax=Steinernema glaseri TaxID=37863 RepID=A0A1I7YV84_9BILA
MPWKEKKMGLGVDMTPRTAFMPLSSRIYEEHAKAKRIYLVRNGECCDRLMPCWRMRAFADHNTYRLIDLNQPMRIPKRSGGPDAFLNDSPLTQVGSFSAHLLGRAMLMRKFTIDNVFCSPALRCIQTAEYILSMMQQKISPKIRVEPGLFEPLMFYWQDQLPSFMSTRELLNAGFNVDGEYQPVISVTDLKERLFKEKHPDDSFHRIATVADSIVECSNKGPGAILVVTHAPSVDILFRQITNRTDQPRTIGDLYRMGVMYPFGSSIVLEQEQPAPTQENPKSTWVHKLGALPPLTCSHVSNAVEVPDFS